MAKILVVDDDADVRQVTCLQLQQGGHDVVTADRGSVAVDLLEADGFELVVTDVRMPGMSGDELIERVRAIQPNLPIIALTGAGSGFKLAGVDVLGKPVRATQLREAVARLLNPPA